MRQLIFLIVAMLLPGLALAEEAIGITEVINFAVGNWDAMTNVARGFIILVVLMVLAPQIAAWTPSKRDDLWIEQNGTILANMRRQLWNFVTGNYGKAKNGPG